MAEHYNFQTKTWHKEDTEAADVREQALTRAYDNVNYGAGAAPPPMAAAPPPMGGASYAPPQVGHRDFCLALTCLCMLGVCGMSHVPCVRRAGLDLGPVPVCRADMLSVSLVHSVGKLMLGDHRTIMNRHADTDDTTTTQPPRTQIAKAAQTAPPGRPGEPRR